MCCISAGRTDSVSSDCVSSIEPSSSALPCELSLLSDLDRLFFFLCCLVLAPSAVAEDAHCSLEIDPPRGTLFRKAEFLGCLLEANEVNEVDDPMSDEEVIEAAAAITPAVTGRVLGAITN